MDCWKIRLELFRGHDTHQGVVVTPRSLPCSGLGHLMRVGQYRQLEKVSLYQCYLLLSHQGSVSNSDECMN